jgi:hypothetical protein
VCRRRHRRRPRCRRHRRRPMTISRTGLRV